MNKILAKSNKNETTLFDHTKGLFEQFDILKSVIKNTDKANFFDSFENLLKYSMFAHDLGKVSPSFQLLMNNEKYSPKVPFPKIPHSIFSLLWIDEDKIKKIFKDEKDKTIFLSSVAFHHWRENFIEIILGQNSDIQRGIKKVLEDEPFREKLLKNLKDELAENEYFKNYLEIIGFNEELAETMAEGDHILSFVIPPYTNYFLPKRIDGLNEDSNIKFIKTLGTLMRCDHFASYIQDEGLDKEEKDKNTFTIEKEVPSYKTIEKSIIEKINKDIWQLKDVKNNKNKNLILVAPTGIGKTEFAYLWGAGEKLFITLPLRSAVNSIFDRSAKYFEENYNEEKKDIPKNVSLLHSDADIYLSNIIDKRESSNNLENAENTEIEGENIRVQEMASHLSYPVIVSTGDQIFPSALKSAGYEKIYSVLSYSKLVIDEVQAYDPQAIAVIIKLTQDITILGGKFLLMTATLPNFVKKEIEERCNFKLNNENNFIDKYNGLENYKKHKIKLIQDDLTKSEYIMEDIISKSNEGNRVLVLFNTVKSAQEFFKKLNDKKIENIYLLHSKFTQDDRQNKEKSIINTEFLNPKEKNDNKGKILVSTQIVEASVDIDCDILYTEIAPMDALVQRMGRVLRREKINVGKENRFEYSNEEANIKIFYKKDKKNFESSNGYVYENEILEKTILLFYLLISETISNDDFLKLEDIDFLNEKRQNLEKKFSSEKIINKTKKNNKQNSNKENEEQIDLKELFNYCNDKFNKSILISELDKKNLVESLYSIIFKSEKSEYRNRFYNAIKILDSGYVSDSKAEAREFFRDISSVPAICNDKKDDFLKTIDKFIQENENNKKKLTYTDFKKDVLSKFIINIELYQVDKGSNSMTLSNSFKNNKEIEDKNIVNRFYKWLKNTYIFDGFYDDKLGAVFNKDASKKKMSFEFL